MRTIIPLNSDWQFAKHPAAETPPFDPGAQPCEAVTLPHCWNAEDGQSGSQYYRGCCAYYRYLTIPQDVGCCAVEILGANSVCRVYLNDTFLGEHRGGYATFRVDLTGRYTPGGTDLLTVLVDNSETEDVSPLAGDFTIFGGLYRDVNLICTPAAHFDLSYYGTSGVLLRPVVNKDGNGILGISAKICGDCKSLTHTVFDPEGSVVAQVETTDAEASLLVPTPALWDGKQAPNLYTVRSVLTSSTGEEDVVTQKTGFRCYQVDANRGFFLNGRSYPLRGVAKHQDRQGCGNAVAKAQMEEDISILEELGANAVRLSHYQHGQYFYDLCDQNGYAVWAEIPMLKMTESQPLLENAKMQLTELILQNLHHPSIFFWGLQNEIAIAGETLYMYQGVAQLQALAHQLDPNRLTTSANLYCVKNNSPLNTATDVVAYNLYYGWYYGKMQEYGDFIAQFRQANPDVCLGFSEYGVDCNLALHSETPHVKDYSEEFQALFHQTVYPILDQPCVWGTFVWNLCDFGSAMRNEGRTRGRNAKGLVSYDRKIRKDAFYYYKACWSKEPFVHVNGRRFADRALDEITVTVYSNQPQVELLVNGKPFARQTGGPVFTFAQVPLAPGENTVTARSGACSDTVTWNKVEEPNQSYIYVDPNPGYNVDNWFTLGQTKEDLFPADRFSLMDNIGDLMENAEAAAIIQSELPEIFKDPRMTQAKTFSLFRIVDRMSGSFPEEKIKALNSRLNQIPKP